MIQFEVELDDLKKQVVEMWEMVYSQLKKTQNAFASLDADLALEVINLEKKIDAYELIIDQMCEKLIALHSPVAIDLRVIISSLKINGNLERIGDLTHGIALCIKELKISGLDKSFVQKTKLDEMFAEALNMLAIVKGAFKMEDTRLAATVFAKDELLDKLNKGAVTQMVEILEQEPEKIRQAFTVFTIVRKLERIGDHCTNIAEEITFYLEAKILKHNNQK